MLFITDTQALRREKRARSRSPSESITEDGEISKYDTFPPPSPKQPTTKTKTKEDLDSTSASVADFNAARVSRYEIVDMMFKDGFKDVLIGTLVLVPLTPGAYVRLMAKDLDAQGRPKYRINRIVGEQ